MKVKRELLTESSSTCPSSNSANGQQFNSEDVDRAEKHAKSEEKRVQSLLQKREFERQRQSVVSDTLKKVDLTSGTGLNKKIRFDSDSDDDAAPTTATTATTSSAALANGSTSNGANGSSSTLKKPALFDEEDDDNDGELEEEDDEAFALKPHFFGKKGAELMALEARYGGDNRFKLSDKFVEEDDDAIMPLSQDPEEAIRQQEKSNALGILERVLGQNLRGNNYDEEGTVSTGAAARPLIVRFDPNNPEHERYDLAKPTKAEESSSSEDEEETADQSSDKQEPVAKKPKHVPSYHMDASFAESLRARLAQPAGAQDEQSAQPFSLLSALGRQSLPDSLPTFSKASLPSTTQPLPQLEKWQSIQSHLADSSDSDGEEEQTVDQRKSSTVSASKPGSGSCHFFLDADDPIVAKTVQRFRRTEDIEVVKKKWSKYRESIVKCYKRQKKLAVRTAKAKEREQYRTHPQLPTTTQQSNGQLARESKAFPRRSSAAKESQLLEKNHSMKAKRLAKKKRRNATKKATTEPAKNELSEAI